MLSVLSTLLTKMKTVQQAVSSIEVERQIHPAIEDLQELLELKNKKFERFNCGDLNFIYYINKEFDHKHISLFDDFDHCRKASEILENLILSLSEGAPGPLKQEFISLLRIIAELIFFLIQRQRQSQEKLINYIESCMELEDKVFQRFQNQIENSSGDDTRVLKTLDRIVDSDLNPEMELFEQPENSKIVFTSDNTYISRLYQTFLQMCIKKPQQRKKFVKLMIDLFKKHSQTNFLDLDGFTDRELKLKYFYDTFLPRLIPKDFHSNLNQLSSCIKFFPEEKPEIIDPISNVELPSLVEHKDSASLFENETLISKTDQIKLIYSLKEIIPQMTDFCEFNLDFPKIMNCYLNFFNSGNYYIDNSDTKFVQKIIEFTNLFIDYENGEIDEDFGIEECMDSFYNLHLCLTEKTSTKSLLMRLAFVEYSQQLRISKTYIRYWTNKTLAIHHLQYMAQEWEINTLKKLITLWYNTTKRNQKLLVTAKKISDLKLMIKFFEKWFNNVNHITNLSKIAANYTQSKTLKTWKERSFQIDIQNKLAVEHHNKNLMKRTFHDIVRLYIQNSKLSVIHGEILSELQVKNSQLKKQTIFSHWKDKAGVDSQKINLLTEKYRQFVLKKYLQTWVKKHSMEQKLQSVVSLNNKLKLKFFLIEKWKKKYDLQKLANEHLQKIHKSFARNIFTHWNNLKLQYEKADKLRHRILLKRTFQQWKLMMINKESRNLQPEYFNKWRLLFRVRRIEEKKKQEFLKKYFYKWHDVTINLSTREKKLIVPIENQLIKKYFNIWITSINSETQLTQIADLNVQRKFYNIFLQKFSKCQQLKLKLLKLTKIKLADKAALMSCFVKWQSKYEHEFEKSKELQVEIFKHKVSNKMIISRYLQIWANKYNSNQEKYDIMYQTSENFLRNSSTMVNIFTKWHSKTRNTQDLKENAINFQNQVMYKRHLVKWYDKFSRIDYLQEVADSTISQKDLNTGRELLNKWSMKIIKIKRLQQSCELFSSRWSTAKARSIFDMWLYKSRRRSANLQDTSTLSIQSPLANKSRATPENESYLSTPIKKREKLFYTPSTRISPPKIQETTERLKNKRIDALIKHYQKARLQGRKPIPHTIIPPKRPNFTPKPHSNLESDEEDIFIRSPLYEDRSTVETAKALRRITPIFIPTTEEETAPRFSPVSKLKERIEHIRGPITELSSTPN